MGLSPQFELLGDTEKNSPLFNRKRKEKQNRFGVIHFKTNKIKISKKPWFCILFGKLNPHNKAGGEEFVLAKIPIKIVSPIISPDKNIHAEPKENPHLKEAFLSLQRVIEAHNEKQNEQTRPGGKTGEKKTTYR